MKQKKNLFLKIGALVFVAAAGIIFFIWANGPELKSQLETAEAGLSDTVAENTHSQKTESALQQRGLDIANVKSAIAPLNAEPAIVEPSTIVINENNRGFKETLASFKNLYSKAILSSIEKEEKYKIFASKEFWAGVWTNVQDSNPAALSVTNREQRFLILDAISEGLEIEKNNQSIVISDKIVEILKVFPATAGLNEFQKRELFGERVELFAYLARTFPEKAHLLALEPKEPKLKELIAFAESRFGKSLYANEKVKQQ